MHNFFDIEYLFWPEIVDNAKSQMCKGQFKRTFARKILMSIKKAIAPGLHIQTFFIQNDLCFAQWAVMPLSWIINMNTYDIMLQVLATSSCM